jgi:DNA repair protein RecO (recombination protein O)
VSTYQTNGIILKISDRGEADQLFSIYSEKKGKVMALGKGTKKIQSKLNGQLQPFSLIYLMIAPGKNHDHIASAERLKNFGSIKADLKKIILASFAVEAVEKMTKLGQPETEIYNLLERFFSALEKEKFDLHKVKRFKKMFMVKFLTSLGLTPPNEIINDGKKLEHFFKEHSEVDLETEKFLAKIGA